MGNARNELSNAGSNYNSLQMGLLQRLSRGGRSNLDDSRAPDAVSQPGSSDTGARQIQLGLKMTW
ncbi:MAG: hypothetical protein JO323_02415 [Acidobacteriia bacterium]|nr:hypothetical protein [Terriglobia bacterium]